MQELIQEPLHRTISKIETVQELKEKYIQAYMELFKTGKGGELVHQYIGSDCFYLSSASILKAIQGVYDKNVYISYSIGCSSYMNKPTEETLTKAIEIMEGAIK